MLGVREVGMRRGMYLIIEVSVLFSIYFIGGGL